MHRTYLRVAIASQASDESALNSEKTQVWGILKKIKQLSDNLGSQFNRFNTHDVATVPSFYTSDVSTAYVSRYLLHSQTSR